MLLWSKFNFVGYTQVHPRTMSQKALGTALAKIKNSVSSKSSLYSPVSAAEEEGRFIPSDGMCLDGPPESDSKKLPTSMQPISQSSNRRPWSRSTLVAVISSTIAVVLFLAILTLLDRAPQHKQEISYVPADTNIPPGGWQIHQAGDNIIVHCGSSPEEAKKRGCVWDLMSFSWTHPACYNKNESDAWIEKYGPWKWYLNKDDTEDNALADEVLPYQKRVWTEQGYHVTHCLYIFKLLHLAGMSGHLVTDEGIGMAHTDHCVKMIADPVWTPFETINTRVDLLYGRCVTIV